jgi:hypothetical protein
MSQPTPAVFLHVPKTAGTAIRDALARQLGPALLWYRQIPLTPEQAPGLRQFHDLEQLSQDPGLLADVRVLGGHFPVWRLPPSLQARRPLLLAVLREPVARVLSFYAFVQRETDHPLHTLVAGRTLAQALQQERFAKVLDHAQLRFLATRQGGAWTPEQLQPYPHLIGRHEALPAFLAALQRHTGLQLDLGEDLVNAAEPGYQAALRAQPDFDEAMVRIEALTRRERAFYDTVGELRDSAAG